MTDRPFAAESANRTCPLPGARKLGYAEGGDREGAPVFYFHGFPGSRLEATLLPASGIRLIGVDRPGYGLSTARPYRKLRSEEHTSELQSLMRISNAVFC